MDSPFIVVLSNPGDNNEVIDRIMQQPDWLKLRDHVWLVRSPELVADLSNQLGLGDEPLGTGIVFRLNGTYWGRASQNTWDWLSRGRRYA